MFTSLTLAVNKLIGDRTQNVSLIVKDFRHIKYSLKNQHELKINFYFLWIFCPQLGSFLCCFFFPYVSAKFHLWPSSGDFYCNLWVLKQHKKLPRWGQKVREKWKLILRLRSLISKWFQLKDNQHEIIWLNGILFLSDEEEHLQNNQILKAQSAEAMEYIECISTEGYDPSKTSVQDMTPDRKATALEIWGLWGTLSFASPLWHRDEEPKEVLSVK